MRYQLTDATRNKFTSETASKAAKIGAQKRYRPFAVRLWSKIEKRSPDECWPWTGATHAYGYGVINLGTGKGNSFAHRAAWEDTNGPIPDGMCALHKCDNPPCCNPAHLFLGTKKDNTHDMIAKGRAKITFGSAHPRAKITEADVKELRLMHELGWTYSMIAKHFNIAKATAHHAGQGRHWKHVK